MPNTYFTDSTAWGAQFIYSASGLLNSLKSLESVGSSDYSTLNTKIATTSGHFIAKDNQFQAGEMWQRVAGDIFATGYFRVPYTTIPYVEFTPHVNTSGIFWISASGLTTFTVRLLNCPNQGDVGTGATTFPYKLGSWQAYPYPHYNP
jgi:hypothetical protein